MAQKKAETAARKPVGQSVSAARRVSRLGRHARLRKKIAGSPHRPRLVVHRSARHIHVQLVNDENGTTLAAASSIQADVRNLEGDKAAGIDTAVFDRGGYTYGGRIAALADAARENGLSF